MKQLEKKDIRHSYQVAMQDMRSDLNPIERIFSRLIHAPLIGSLGSVLAASILRPRSLLAGAWMGLLAITITALFSYAYHYTATGLEAVIGFAVGWLAGIVYDIFAYPFKR